MNIYIIEIVESCKIQKSEKFPAATGIRTLASSFICRHPNLYIFRYPVHMHVVALAHTLTMPSMQCFVCTTKHEGHTNLEM